MLMHKVHSAIKARLLRPACRRRGNERGTTLVEMALAGPLFFMLLFGVTEFGRAIWLYGTMAHAAREATRYAVVRGAESGRAVKASDVETYVHNRAPGLSSAEVTTSWEPDNQPGSVVQIKVELSFVPVVPVFPSVPFSTTSRMVISF